MAKHLIADLYGCDFNILNDENAIRQIAAHCVKTIGANIVEECVKKFDPIGITYFAIISTSHFSIHTWPEHGYAAVDVFSCSEIIVNNLLEELKSSFKPQKVELNMIERKVGDVWITIK